MRKLAVFSLAFGGAVLLCCCGAEDWAAVLGAGCAAAGLLTRLLPKGRGRRRLLLCALGAAAGFLWFAVWTALFLSPVAELAGSEDVFLTAVALDYPQEAVGGESVEVRLSRGVTARLYIRGGQALDVRPGDTLSFTAGVERADLLRGEENDWFTSRGVFLLAYADGEEVEVRRPASVPLALRPVVWSRALGEALDGLFPPESAALLRAMLLGDRTGLSDGAESSFSRSGLIHLLVVSGLHMTVLLRALVSLLRTRRRWLAPVSIPVLVLYTLMAGWTPSAVRAAIMSSLLLLAPLARRESDALTSLGAALLALLLQNPYAAAGASLQLSFASVAGILLVGDPLGQRLRRAVPRNLAPWKGRCLSLLAGSLSTTAGAMVFTVPILAVRFGVVSIVAPLSNLLVLWAASLLFVLGLICALTALILPWAAAILSLPTGLLCRYVLAMARVLGTPAYAAVTMDSPYVVLWLAAIYLLVLFAFLFRRDRPARVVIPLCAPAVLLCAALALTRVSSDSARLTVTALDVGQGSSTLFLSDGRAVLVDCGGNCLGGAGNAAADHLQSLGYSAVDLLVLTHLDDDHCNGVSSLFDRLEVRAVALPDRDDGSGSFSELLALCETEGAEVTLVTERIETVLGECTFTLYPPLGAGDANEEGIFVRCAAEGFSALITGDAGALAESMLVKYCGLPPTDLLFLGHHGARSSTSQTLLDALEPTWAIVSSGYNSYGHPHGETLARLAGAGVSLYRTDLQGTVTLTIH